MKRFAPFVFLLALLCWAAPAAAQNCSGEPNANWICAGPASGSPAPPAWRPLATADIAGIPGVPLMWQPQASNCDSGHSPWFVDQNFCATWDQSFVTDTDPSVLVAIPVGGTAGPTGATQTLTFLFGSGACNAGCPASYTFQAMSFTASISGTTMTVTSVPTGNLQIGQAITGTGVTGGTVITGPIPGQGTWFGGPGTYTVNNSQSVGSRTLTATDTLNSIAWGLSNAIKANANLYNPTATNTSQQRQIIWSTANTPAPQISLDIDGRTPLKITTTSSGGSTVTSTPPGTCPSSVCPLFMDVGPSITYTRASSPTFVPTAGSNVFQTFWGGVASGGSGVYGQVSVSVVDPTISLGSVFISGQWASGIPAGVYVSKGLYSLNNSDHGVDTAAFTEFDGSFFSGAIFGCTNINLGTVTTDCFSATNNTAAANGAQQFSPDLRLSGTGWQTTTPRSEQVDWRVVNEPIQGTTHPLSNLTFNFQVNGGGYVREANLASNGIFNANLGYTVNGSAPAGHVLCGNGSAYIDCPSLQIIPISSGTLSQAQNTTQFVLTLNNATEASIQALCPASGTFKNLFVQATAPASGQTLTATWRVNNTSTAITCTITGPATTCNDTTHTAACTAGQPYSLQSVTSATSGAIASLDGGIQFGSP